MKTLTLIMGLALLGCSKTKTDLTPMEEDRPLTADEIGGMKFNITQRSVTYSDILNLVFLPVVEEGVKPSVTGQFVTAGLGCVVHELGRGEYSYDFETGTVSFTLEFPGGGFLYDGDITMVGGEIVGRGHWTMPDDPMDCVGEVFQQNGGSWEGMEGWFVVPPLTGGGYPVGERVGILGAYVFSDTGELLFSSEVEFLESPKGSKDGSR